MNVEIMVQMREDDVFEPLNASHVVPSGMMDPYINFEIRVDGQTAFRLEKCRRCDIDLEQWVTINEFLKMFDIVQPIFDSLMTYGTAAVKRLPDGTIEKIDMRKVLIKEREDGWIG